MTNTNQLKEIIDKLIEKGYSEFEIIDAEMPMYRREYKFRDGCEFRVNYPILRICPRTFTPNNNTIIRNLFHTDNVCNTPISSAIVSALLQCKERGLII